MKTDWQEAIGKAEGPADFRVWVAYLIFLVILFGDDDE